MRNSSHAKHLTEKDSLAFSQPANSTSGRVLAGGSRFLNRCWASREKNCGCAALVQEPLLPRSPIPDSAHSRTTNTALCGFFGLIRGLEDIDDLSDVTAGAL